MRWRFFECFEQGIKSLSREHVYFVNNINLALALRSRIPHLFAQLPDLINPAIRSPVNLQHIHAVALANGNTRSTFPTRFSRWPMLAVECHSKQSRCRGLPRSSRPGKQVRLRHALQPNGVLQCGGHMALCNHCFKCLWPPLSGHYRVRHKNSKRCAHQSLIPSLCLIKKGRAPRFEPLLQGVQRALAPARCPCGTRTDLLTAATFRS